MIYSGRKERGDKQKTAGNPLRRRRRRAGHQTGSSSHLWLLSFTDVMALMLTFFVLLFAMSKPRTQDWSDVTSSLHQELNRFYGALGNKGPEDTISLGKINFNRALDINYLRVVIESMVKEDRALDAVTFTVQPDRLILSLPQDFLFDTGKTNIKESGSRAIYALGGTLSRIKNRIEIIGHADPRPVQGSAGPYDNNWELSLARAASVAGLLESVGYKRDIAIRGLSSGRYQDLAGIVKNEAERLGISRRVDIVILDNDGSRRSFFMLQ